MNLVTGVQLISKADKEESFSSPYTERKSHNARAHESSTGIVNIPETKRPCKDLL